ncbi:Rha family transcriptional regulator [Acinetobacter tibetensis]|jgi:phage regulator Rha-like protein|uniref:Rha family transcriptional regulator n=1 Tax=Acinetobacter tibetensis TaxID=2943497 RepID=A0AAE9LQ20_9GAMM|nr:Rha family transcriptional regulator [Acinetobacter tibetensis]USE82569.1 Rha family transcriptional regulator [Acinetobacter tibetensis]
MNQILSPTPTMSSREIAELTGKEHKNVIRTIKDLLAAEILDAQIEPLKFEYRGQWFDYYELKKRDSLILVARLSPEFTARLVDRWQELEYQSKQHNVDINNPHALRKALLEYTEQVIELEHKNTGLEKSIKVITQTNHGVKFQQACKILNIKRSVLADWLSKHGWDRRLNNARASTHYSQERGYCETKYEERTKIKANGELGSYSQIEFFILPKGMEVLAKHFGIRG